MRSFFVILLVLVVAAPAAATDPSGAEEVTELADLVMEAEAEIAFYEIASRVEKERLPLPVIDIASRLEARMLRADAFLGYLRSRANDFLHFVLPPDAAHLVNGLDAGLDEAAISTALDASDLSSAAVWASEQIAPDWIRFQRAITRLRELVAPGSPDRVCPVDGPTFFRNEWEFPRPWGRIHKGVDLHADLGTPLVAIEDGVVIQANWHYLGGRQVYVKADSTGDVYYYAHLEFWPRWLWTGTRLKAGDFLGLAGSSGNALTPHLHLGWMPRSKTVDLDNLQNAYFLMFELCN